MDDIDKRLKNILNTLPTEELYIEAFREVLKDLIKEYIKKRINSNDELKNEISNVLKEYMEAKLKEYDSVAKMTKLTAKIGLISAPSDIKEQAINDFINTFQKEIEDIIKKTI